MKCRRSPETRFGRFLIFSFFDVEIFSKLRTAVYPPRMAPFGLKLWENAFQMIPDISFSTLNKKIDKHFRRTNFVGNFFVGFFASCLFWRSYDILDVTIRCASKIHCQTYRFQPSMTLGGGVKEAVSVFDVTFGEKKLKPSSLRNSIL